MKHLILALCMCIPPILSVSAQDNADINAKVADIRKVIVEQTPMLQEYAEALDVHREELEERAIVLKYHKGNREVDDQTNKAVARIEDYNKEAEEVIIAYQAVWFDQLKNVMDIYTRFGEMKETSGGGATDLDDFVKSHREYLDLMEEVKTSIEFIYADCGYLRQ